MRPDNSKKRKRPSGSHNGPSPSNGLDTSKPTAVFKPTAGRASTLSVALPGSIIANAQSPELKATLAGQIARALAVFCVDEIVIFDDGQGNTTRPHRPEMPDDQQYTGFSDPDHFLIHLLSYLETPPHLRKHLFPLHPNLRSAGTLPSLDMPHHLRADEWCEFREGVTMVEERASTANSTESNFSKLGAKSGKGKQHTRANQPSGPVKTLIESGLKKRVMIEADIPPNTRVTLRFAEDEAAASKADHLIAEAVAPEVPREEVGYYWGYSVRRAPSISAVFTECPYDGGYDLSIGTSERGGSINDVSPISKFRHMMVIFGGVAGLEVAVRSDDELANLNVTGPEALFDHWVNLCPGQGSRTIRTEEAVWIGLMGLRKVVVDNAR
ncbi:MAG: hypothetical protein M1817_004672 [Caeruleum heppii]|nr:MAG: hypothetical protein M1817_004672 [Caeruleum heppii]